MEILLKITIFDLFTTIKESKNDNLLSKIVVLLVRPTGIEPALLSKLEPNGSDTTVNLKIRP